MSSSPGEDRAGRAVDAGEMPVAYEARNEFEAQCVRSVLEDAGIRSVTLPSGQAIFGFPMRAGAAGVPVRVLAEDLSRAKQVIAESRWVGRSVDWDEVDVGEMPPDVARIMARTRRDRWVQRAVMAVAWLALLVVVGSIALGLLRAIVR